MILTAEVIKDTVQIQLIDHQLLKIINLRNFLT